MAVDNLDAFQGKVDIDAIYRQYALPLKKYIYSVCKDSDLADDIVSETFYRAIKNIKSFYGGNVFTWLCTIAKNIYFNHAKRKETKNISLEDIPTEGPSMASSVEETVVQKQRSIEVYKNMQALDSVEREVIYLRNFAELSFKEIGEILNKSENWSRVTYFRCKEKLKRRMSDE